MNLSILNAKGKETSKKAKLSDAVFAIEPNDHAIYLDVKYHMANQRAGTHKAKERGEITGSRKKIRKQKGTGAARAGDIKNPIYRGGGRVFGPKPRTYSTKLNKKMRQLARRSALSHKTKSKSLFVLEDLKFDKAGTKQYAEMLRSLNVDNGNTLLVMAKADENILLSSRNIKYASVLAASDLNTYDILNAKNLLILESSVKEIESLLS